MDWLKLFALLVAVASVKITAEGPKKKIRIHLPQKVKHIHHHKKIYITNHPASSQYAPAYLPGVKGSVALPSNVARPSVASLVPLNSVELYEEPRSRLPGVSPAASKLLPLYRARGHYGPNPSEWDEQDYDLAPPHEPDSYAPSGYAAPPPPVKHHPKRVKYVKLNEGPRKKVIRKIKPKRILYRGRPQPQPHPDDEHPVSSFHEQFYSELEDAGTIKKVRKPPRIEKIIDGDTEHIHTYSEEHIHKVIFDDDSKVGGVVAVDPIRGLSSLAGGNPLTPFKNAQTLVAIPSESLANFAVVGSMGTPSHLEYSAYNPHEVTHDHIFHDHGELPRGVEVTKETLRLPPKVSYNSQGLPITSGSKRYPVKHHRLYSKPTKPTADFSYYENLYIPNHRPKNVPKPTNPTPFYDNPSSNLNDFRPIPAFRFKEKRKAKSYNPNPHFGKPIPNFQLQQASVPTPFSVSNTVFHDYDPKNYAGAASSYAGGGTSYTGVGSSPASFSKFKDHLADFKDTYSNDFDYDAFASSSNLYTSEDKNESSQGKGKKSVSTQNISFGGQDHQTFVDHFASSSNSQATISDAAPTAAENTGNFDQTTDPSSPTPYTIKETSPVHQYYSVMALKALHGDQPEASNDNLQYAEPPAPTDSTTDSTLTTTPSQSTNYYKIQSTDAIQPDSEFITEQRHGKKRREKNGNQGDQRQKYSAAFKDILSTVNEYRERQKPAHRQRHQEKYSYIESTDSTSARGNPQYGDKI